MRVYADASLLVALFTSDPFTQRADHFLRSARPLLLLSDFASVEVSSAIARKVRTNSMLALEAEAALIKFDQWARDTASLVKLSTEDLSDATTLIRRFALKLRTADALNVAIAQRMAVPIATFDRGMAAAAASLGVDLVAC